MLFGRIINYLKRIFHINNSTYYINGSENLLPPLNKDEEELALSEYKLGSIAARNTLIEHNLRWYMLRNDMNQIYIIWKT